MASNPPDFRDRARQKLARPPGRTTALDPLDPKAILAEAEGLGVGNLNVRNLAQGIRQGSISPEAARSYVENVREAQINPNSDNLDTLPPPVTEEQANTPTASFDTRSPADRKREIESMRQEFHRPPSAVDRADAALLTQAASSLNVRPLPTVIGPAQRAVAATPNLPKPPAVEQERRVGRAVPLEKGHQALNKALPFNYREQERALRQSMPIDPLTGDRFEPPSRPLQAPVDARNPRTLAQGEGREQAVQKAIESLYGLGGGLFAASPAGIAQAEAIESGAVSQEPPKGEGFEPLRNLWRGLAAGTMGLAESTGTILRYLGGELNLESVASMGESVEEYFQPRMQQYARRAAETFRSDQNIWDNPELLLDLDFLTFTVGQIVPSLFAAITPAGLTRAVVKKGLERQLARKVGRLGRVEKRAETDKFLKIGKRSIDVGKSAKGAENQAKLARIGKAATAAGLTAGGLAGGALEGSATYRETFDTLMDQGVPEDVARQTAENAFLMMTGASGVLNAVGLKALLKAVPALGSIEGIKARTIRGLVEGLTEWLEGPAEALIQIGQDTITPEQAIQKIKEELNVAPAAFITGFFLPGAGGRLLNFNNDSIKGPAQEASEAAESVVEDQDDPGDLPPPAPPAGPAGQAVNVTTPEASGTAQAQQEEVDETTQQEPDDGEAKPETGKVAPKPEPSPEAEPTQEEDEVVTELEELVPKPDALTGEELSLTARVALGEDDAGDPNILGFADSALESLAVDLGIDRINAGESREEFVDRIQERARSVVEGQDAPAAQPQGIFEQERAAELEQVRAAEAQVDPEIIEEWVGLHNKDQLKQAAAERGLPTTGNKRDLAKRIIADNIVNQQIRDAENAAAVPEDQAEVPAEGAVTEGGGREGGEDIQQPPGRTEREARPDREGQARQAEKPAKTADEIQVEAETEPEPTKAELDAREQRGDEIEIVDTGMGKFVVYGDGAVIGEASSRKAAEEIVSREREGLPPVEKAPTAKKKKKKKKKAAEKPKNIIDTKRLGEVFDNPDLELTNEDVNLDVFTADELKEVLRGRGLKVGGNKSVLRERLVENQIRAGQPQQGMLLSDTSRERVVSTNKGTLQVDEGFNENLGMRTFTAKGEKGETVAEVYVNPDDETLASIEVDEDLRGAGVANSLMDEIEATTGKKLKPSDNLSYDGYRMWVKRDPKAVENSYHALRDEVLGQTFEVQGEGTVQVVDMGNQRLSVRNPDKPSVTFALRPEQAEVIVERARERESLNAMSPRDRVKAMRKRQQQLRERDELGEPLLSDSLFDNESIDELLERERESLGIIVEETRLPSGEIPSPVGRTEEEVRENLRAARRRTDAQERHEFDATTVQDGDFRIVDSDGIVEINLEGPDGRDVGYIAAEKSPYHDGSLVVRVAEVSKEFQGRKLGQAMIKRMHKYATERGLVYRSDETVSSDQLRAYEALSRRGWEVIYSDPIHVMEVLERANNSLRAVFSYIGTDVSIVTSLKSPAQVDEELFGDPLLKDEGESKVRVTISAAEREEINKLSKKSGVSAKRIEAKVRQDRQDKPPSKGWARMTVDSSKASHVTFDAKKGEITKLVYKKIPYGFHKDKQRDGAFTTSKKNQQRKKTKQRRLAKIIVERVKQLQELAQEGDGLAASILAERTWYSALVKRLPREFGGAANLIADLLGATSPQNPVPQNFKDTMHAVEMLSEGAYDEQMKAFVKHVEDGGTYSNYKGPIVTKESGAKYGVSTGSVMWSMSKLWRVLRPKMLPKARNFTGNLVGESTMATIDVWAARFLNRISEEKRVPPQAEGSVDGSYNKKLEVTGQYGFAAEIFDMAAEELGWSAPELQAVMWFDEKAIWEKAGWTPVEGGSFNDELDFLNPRRFFSGLSIQVGSKKPSQSAVRKVQRQIQKFFTQVRGVVSFRQASTLGLYGGDVERSFDIEATVTPTFDLNEFVASQAQIAQDAKQDDVFVSRVVGAEEENSNARPGIEVFFDSAKSLKEVQPILDSMVADGIDGLTMVVDPRARLFGIDNRKFIGVRYQYVPEFAARFDESFRKEFRRDGMAPILEEKKKQLIAAADSLLDLGAKSYHIFEYDTLVIGKENYSEYTDPAGTANQATGRVWFGGSIDQSVEAAIVRIESGEAAAKRKRVQRGGDKTGREGGQGEEATLEERAGRSKPRTIRSPISLARLTDTFGQAVTEIYGRFGALTNKDTTKDLKIYDLQPLVKDKQAALNQAAQHGYLVKLFSFVEDKEAGIEFKIPKLKVDGYEQGTVWIYNPRNPAGSFKDEDYTTAWRITHEVAHGITEQFMQAKYGDSKRYGRMGRTATGVLGTADKQVEVTLPPLTLKQAQRAVEWEEVTFRVQRILLEELGITITEEQFNQENAINISDATYRVATGEFGDPGEYGFVPSDTFVDVKDVLIALEETEALLAADQGREPSEGINLNTWKRIPESTLRTAIREAKQNGRHTASEKAASVGQSATGAILTEKDFRPRATVSEIPTPAGATTASEGAVSEQHDPHDNDTLFKSDDRTIVYRDKDAKARPTGVNEDEARFAILDIINKVGNLVGIRVVQKQSELPTKHKSRVQGAFYPKAKMLYIVADNHSSTAEIKKTILHEVFGHFSMRNMNGFKTLLRAVKAIIDSKDDATLNRVVQNVQARGTVSEEVFVEEVIAHLAEESSGRNAALKEFISAVQEFVRALGFDVKLNNNDVIALIRQQRRRTEHNAMAAAGFGFTKNSEEFRKFLKSDHMQALRSAENDQQIGLALQNLSIEFDKPLFSSSAKMNGKLDDDWNEKMNIPTRDLSWPDRIKRMAQAFSDLSFDEMTQGLIDSANAVKTNEIEAFGELLDASVSPYKSMSTLRNLSNVMGAVMRHGIPQLVENVYTLTDNTKIKGLNFVAPEDAQSFGEIFSPLSQIPGDSQLRNWEIYAVAVRAKFIIGEDKRAGRKGDKRREKLIPEHLADETIAWANAQVAPNGKTYAEIFDETLAKWNDLNQANIQLAIDTGVLNEEESKIWKNNPYVPFWRELAQLEEQQKPGGGRSRVDVENAGLYRLTGSLDREGNPVKLEGNIIESMFMNTAWLLDRSYRNEATRRVVDVGERIGSITRTPKKARPVITVSKEELINLLWKSGILNAQSMKDAKTEFAKLPKTDKERWATFFSRVKPPGPNIVTVMEKGKQVYYTVNDPLLLRSIVGTNETSGTWMTLMRGSKKWLTIGVTTDPAFMLANWMRDTITTFIVADVPIKSLGDIPKGLRDAYKESPALMHIAFAGRGGGNLYDTHPDNVIGLLKELGVTDTAGHMKTVVSPKNLWKFWRKVGSASEFGNRVRVYNSLVADWNKRIAALRSQGLNPQEAWQQAVRDGYTTPAEAAYQAQDLLNFTRSGDWRATQIAIQVIPFLNARVQGLNRLYRGAKDNPMSFMMKGGSLMMVSLMLAIANDDDDRYNELSEWDKDTYYHFWIDGQHWRLPKPFESGVIFSTVVERFYRAFKGVDGWDVTADSALHALGSTFMFTPVPQLFKPWAEDYFNHNIFMDTPIVTAGQENLLPERQYDFRTGEFAKWVGRTVPDAAPDWLQSPKRFEHLIRGFFGALGTYTLSAANVMTDTLIEGPDRVLGELSAKRLHEMPVVSRFKRGDIPTTTKYNRILWELVREADALARTIKVYQEEGEGERAFNLARDEAQLIALRPRIRQIAGEVSKVNKQLNRIALDRRISPERRAQIRDQLLKRRNALAARIDPLIEYL